MWSGTRERIIKLINAVGSLKITVVLLALAIGVIFVGTICQKRLGVYTVERLFFNSFLVSINLPSIGIKVPIFPGGYLIGLCLFINLVGAYLSYPKLRKAVGLNLIHVGIGIMLLSQLMVDFFRKEYILRLKVAEPRNYLESEREYELVIAQEGIQGIDDLVIIPERMLATPKEIQVPERPILLKLLQYFHESKLIYHPDLTGTATTNIVIGSTNLGVIGINRILPSEQRLPPSAVVEVISEEGYSIGKYLISGWLPPTHILVSSNKEIIVLFRPRRFHIPYQIELVEFQTTYYPRTSVPRTFLSKVKITDQEGGINGQFHIRMNHPLRYRGLIYYQLGYESDEMQVSILKVVKNPAWFGPYIGCVLIGGGLLIHFTHKLIRNRIYEKC